MEKDDDDRDEGDSGMSITRYQIMPSLISLLIMRNRLHLAFLGKKLMKWTALATGKELRRIAFEIAGVILKYELLIKDAFIMLAQCRFHLPGVNTIILETAPTNAMITFTSSGRSVAGVKVVSFEVRESGRDGYAFLGMGKGGEVIRETKERWRKLVKILIVMCQFRENFILTDAANKAATKKQNVLKRLIVPKILETIKYILSELDEQEREESFRLKRFKQLKYKNPKEESKILKEESEVIIYKPEPIMQKPEPVIEKPEPIKVKPEPVIEILKPVEVTPEPIIEKPKPVVQKPEPIKETPTVTVAPAIIPEPPQVEQPKAETPEVDLIMSHINEVVKLADLLRSSAMLPKHFGLTKCDLGRLKIQLDETIKLSKTSKEDRECVKCQDLERTGSPCTCPASVDAPIKAPATEISKEPPRLKAAVEYQASTKTPTLIPEYILKPRVIPDMEILEDEIKTEKEAKPEGKMNLDELENHIDQVLCMTYCYKKEKLLSVSAEDFLKCCLSVKNKLQEIKIQREVKAKIGLLKDKVEHLEQVTNIVEQELSTTSIGSFMSCCKEFKDKLERRQSCRGAPSVGSIENLVKRIDLSIVLGKEAIKEGLVSESVEEFISTCTEIKEKIDPQEEPKPKVINDLLLNVTDIIKQISKYKDDGQLSKSIEKLFTTCETTKAKLDCYKPPQICPNKMAKQASQQSCKPNMSGTCLVCDEAAKKASQQSLKQKSSSICPKCDEVAKKTSQQSRGSKSSASCKKCDAVALKASQQSLKAKSCESCLICDEAAKKASQQSLKPKTSSTCPKCGDAAKKQSQKSRSPKSSISCQKCNAAAKSASQQSLKAKSCESCLICDEAAKKASQQSLKPESSSSCPKCDAKKRSRQSRGSRSSASCQKCDAAAKKASQQSLKARSCEICLKSDEAAKQQKEKPSYGPKSFTTCLECDKGAKQQSQTSCKSTSKQTSVPAKTRSCICSKKTQSRSDSTHSKADKTHGISKSWECCSFQDVLPTFVQILVSQQSKRPSTIIPFKDLESECIRSVKHRHSESNIFGNACYNKDRKIGLNRQAMSMVIMKTFKNMNSSDKQTVTEFPLPYKLEKAPSQTSSHPTGFCESVESTNSVSLCNKPRTKGFIQIVKNVKSEKLIRCQDLSKSYLPFLWPHSSVDTLISQDRNNECIQENPFF